MRSRFNAERADRACDFFEKLLVHTKDPWARHPFDLAPFQRDEIIRPLFGTETYDKDSRTWVRRYSLAWLEMARKNGKSELLAGIALLLTGADDEEGAEVYGVAKDTDQATLVFAVARRMVELSPVLSEHFKIYPTNRRIVYPKTDSFYRVIAADALGNLGQNPHGIVFDEVIAQPNGDLWDALKTGFGTRRQPLMIAATTSGDDPSSFAKIEHDFSARVAEDPSLAPRRFVFMRNLPDDANPGDESLWSVPNPALGLFLRPQALRDEYESAKNNPREMRAFLQFRMNQWQNVPEDSALPIAEVWQNGAGIVVEDKLKGKRCWGGMVAASSTDLCATCYVFPNPDAKGAGYWFLWRWAVPEESLPDLDRRTNGLASSVWAKPGGPLKVTPGGVLDTVGLTEQVRRDCNTFDVQVMGYDPNGTIGVVSTLLEDRIVDCVPMYPTAPSSALMDWDRLLRGDDGQANHGADPLATWQVYHGRAKEAATGILKIDARSSTENIFGIRAAELALRQALMDVEKKPATLVSF